MVEFEGPDHGEAIRNELVFIGSGSAPYRVIDAKVSGAAFDTSLIRMRSTVQVPGGPPIVAIDKTLAELSAGVGGDPGATIEGSTIECTATTLRLTRTTTAGVIGWVFRRA